MSVTMVELSDLREHDLIDVTIIDDERVRPESRGETIRVTFKGLSEPGVGNRVGNGAEFMLESWGEDDVTVYAFHDWLIEAVERVA